ncbi:MAG: hydrogenase-4 component E [Desulfovibrionaceae bacterium]|nr:hydrogenase-4 component E [Desulfovibrionaceae bacterium]
MMTIDFFQAFLVLLLLNNLGLLWFSRLPSLVALIAIQGMLLAGLLMTIGSNATYLLVLGTAVLLIKGIGLPILLLRTLRRVAIGSSCFPRLSYAWMVLLGLAGLCFSLWMEMRLPIDHDLFPPLLLPAALTTLFSGLIMVVCRTKAMSQVIGYMAAENGIFLIGIPLMTEGGAWFELSILLDVFVAVFVMGIAIHHISSTFESTDVGRFCSLRD